MKDYRYPQYHIPIEEILSWKLDYPENKLKVLIGAGKTPIEICALSTPSYNKLQILLRPEIIPEKQLYLLACEWVKRVLPIWERAYPNDKTPHHALEVRYRWLDNCATNEEMTIVANGALQSAFQADWNNPKAAAVAKAAAMVIPWDIAKVVATIIASTTQKDFADKFAEDFAEEAAWNAAISAARDIQLEDVRQYLLSFIPTFPGGSDDRLVEKVFSLTQGHMSSLW